MKPDGFVLAASLNDLTREPEVRDAADMVEFRMDKATDPITQLDKYDGELSVIATNRAQWFGGQAPDAGRLDRLFAASEFDAVEMVDIELETARGSDWVIPEFQENDVEIIISHHAFEDTPDEDTLLAIFEQCSHYGDIGKVATFAEEYGDALPMLNAVYKATQEGQRVAGILMGPIGSHSRVVAPFYGSALGYAPLASDDEEYAPGQISIHELASIIERLHEASIQPEPPIAIEEEPLQRDVVKSEKT